MALPSSMEPSFALLPAARNRIKGSATFAPRFSIRACGCKFVALPVQGTPSGNYKFLARAWQAANDKARELGELRRAGPCAGLYSSADGGPKLDGDSVR